MSGTADRNMKRIRYAVSWMAIVIVAFPLLVAATIRAATDKLDDTLAGSRFVEAAMRLVDRLEMWGKR
jgi:hypothetical protein